MKRPKYSLRHAADRDLFVNYFLNEIQTGFLLTYHCCTVLWAARTWRLYKLTRSGRKPSCWCGEQLPITGHVITPDNKHWPLMLGMLIF